MKIITGFENVLVFIHAAKALAAKCCFWRCVVFFKKAINPDQFEFATIISTGQLYQRLGRMPTIYEIEDQVLNLIKEFGGKLNSQQMQVLKIAAPRLCFSDSEMLIKRMVSEGAKTDGKAYASLVHLLEGSSIRFC